MLRKIRIKGGMSIIHTVILRERIQMSMESKKTAKQLKIFEPRTTNKKQTRTILVKLVNVLIRHARNIQVAKKKQCKKR